MKNLLFVFIFIITSCSTISTNRNMMLSVKSNAPDAMMKINDTTYQLPAKIWVKRSNKNIPLELKTSSTTKKFELEPFVNYKFVFGNLLFFQLSPIAYALDCTNSKRYAYQSKIFLDINDSIGLIKTPMANNLKKIKNHFSKQYATHKGQTNLVFAMLAVNNFNFKPKGENFKSNLGVGGISLGVEYFYNQKNYLGASIKALPFNNDLDPISFLGESFGSYDFEKLYSISFNLTQNHKLNRFYLGYGLNCTKNLWIRQTYAEQEFGDGIYTYTQKTNNVLGMSLNGSYQISKYFFVGCSYNQSFLDLEYNLNPLYENIFSFDFAFKLPFNKKYR